MGALWERSQAGGVARGGSDGIANFAVKVSNARIEEHGGQRNIDSATPPSPEQFGLSKEMAGKVPHRTFPNIASFRVVLASLLLGTLAGHYLRGKVGVDMGSGLLPYAWDWLLGSSVMIGLMLLREWEPRVRSWLNPTYKSFLAYHAAREEYRKTCEVAEEWERQRRAADEASAAKLEALVRDFGAFLGKFQPEPMRFYDESLLPHPKRDIARSLLLIMATARNTHEKETAYAGLDALSSFQAGVGPTSVGLMPENGEALLAASSAGSISVRDVAVTLSTTRRVNEGRFQELRRLQDQEMQSYRQGALPPDRALT